MMKRSFSLAVLLLAFSSLSAQTDFPVIGSVKTLSAKEIKSSRWSIGGETLDRDYASYDAYKSYLDKLGAKRIRLQGGWAKCEQQRGVYDFAWLDKIVDDARSRGISPWLQLSYGNPIYPGGGQPFLAGGIPTSTEALDAWDKWVIAIVGHFKDRVSEWEIWNEPDLSKMFGARDFIPFYERTAALVRQEQPGARLIALGLADVTKIPYVDSLLSVLKSHGKLSYVDAISYHGYTIRPEDNYNSFLRLKELVRTYSPSIELWQGENGAPSTPAGKAVGAMTKHDWSEITQAKWNLRRMLGDMVYGVDVTNIFQISDMYYAGTDHMAGLNSKGLLMARPDRTIERPKLAYKAYQNTATMFSGDVRKSSAVVEHEEKDLLASVFTKDGVRSPAIVLWFADAKPADDYLPRVVTFSVENVSLKNPVLVDLMSGKVSRIPSANITTAGKKRTFSSIPVGDSPVVIADASWMTIIK